MRLNPTYTLQSIAGKYFIFMRKGEQVDLTQIISLNDSAAWLWMQLEKQEFTCDDAVQLLIGHFDVDYSNASIDVQGWFELLRQNDLLHDSL